MKENNKRLVGRPALEATKVSTTIRLSPEVIETFKASGRGWQTRIDLALKDWLKGHKVAQISGASLNQKYWPLNCGYLNKLKRTHAKINDSLQNTLILANSKRRT